MPYQQEHQLSSISWAELFHKPLLINFDASSTFKKNQLIEKVTGVHVSGLKIDGCSYFDRIDNMILRYLSSLNLYNRLTLVKADNKM